MFLIGGGGERRRIHILNSMEEEDVKGSLRAQDAGHDTSLSVSGSRLRLWGNTSSHSSRSIRPQVPNEGGILPSGPLAIRKGTWSRLFFRLSSGLGFRTKDELVTGKQPRLLIIQANMDH